MTSLQDIKSFHVLPDGQIVQALADETTSGEVVSGATKLAQKFFILLLTRKGSVPYLPNQGTNFLNRFASGMISNEADLFVNFAAALIDLGPQLKSVQAVSDPPAEKYVKAVAEQIFISPDQVEMRIRIDSEQGEGITILLPLNFQVR